MTSSEKETLNLAHLTEALCIADAYMSLSCVTKSEDAVIFLGATKSGKSTLINFLIGNKLIGRKNYFKVCVYKQADSEGPKIGAAVNSETTIPAKYKTQKLPGYAVWDTPGWDDNRGITQDIVNAFYISELFKKNKSTKIIIVVDFATLQDDSINSLRTLLRTIENLFTNKFKDILPGIGMILTKVDILYGFPVTKPDIIKMLHYKLLSNPVIDISEDGKALIQHLVNNSQNIGLVGNAREGPITDDIASTIIEVINRVETLPFNILREIVPGISESAKTSLCEAREQLLALPEFEELETVITKVLENKLGDVKRINNLDNTDDLFELSSVLSVMKDKIEKVKDYTVSFEKKISALENVDLVIKRFIESHKLIEKAKLATFVEKLLNLGENYSLNISITVVLVLALCKIDELIISIKERADEINKEKIRQEIAKVRQQSNNDIEELKKVFKETQSKCTIL